LVGSWARRAITRDFCSALAALVSPVQNILKYFFLNDHFFTIFFPIAQQAEQAVVPRLQSLNKFL
jgi:hypothetical protein